MGLTVLFTHLKIILLQYFQFSVFSFSNNKFNPNRPILSLISSLGFYTYVMECSVCFIGKPSIKIVFHIFQCLVTQKKLSMENYLQSTENLNKNNTYFLQVVFQIFFLENNLSLTVSSLTFSLFPLLFLSSHLHCN